MLRRDAVSLLLLQVRLQVLPFPLPFTLPPLPDEENGPKWHRIERTNQKSFLVSFCFREPFFNQSIKFLSSAFQDQRPLQSARTTAKALLFIVCDAELPLFLAIYTQDFSLFCNSDESGKHRNVGLKKILKLLLT